jgi:hypothetical protein
MQAKVSYLRIQMVHIPATINRWYNLSQPFTGVEDDLCHASEWKSRSFINNERALKFYSPAFPFLAYAMKTTQNPIIRDIEILYVV